MINLKSPRSTMMLVFAGFGAAVGAWAGSIPQIMAAAGIDSYNLGIGITASSLATVIAMSAGGKLGKMFSNRAMLLVAIPLLALVTMFLLTSGSAWFFFASLTGFGAVLGLTDVFMNAEASAIEHDARRPIFTAFHASASLSLAAFAIASSFLTATRSTAATGLVVVASLVLAWLMVYCFVPARKLTPGKSSSVAILSSRLPLIIMGLATGLSISAETAATLWSAKLLNEQAPSLAAIAGLGAAFYGICNAAVRFMGDALRSHFGEIPLMLFSLLLAMAGFTTLGLSTSFTLSVVAFAAVGFGLSILCPCLFNMAAAQVPANRAAGLSFISTVAGLPRILAPWVFGWIATIYSTSFAFGLCTVVLAVAFGLIMNLRSLIKVRADNS